ncbi:MAG: 4Fe-4S dicluster domain-containing protein [Deltaproteobacteria bacterium]|jgi:ferredoxin|nr:4Fe-4S dicluster domain-containing protein [Deltaproteobacteria bacterium]
MGHNTSRRSYRDLIERLNRFPQGVHPSELLYRILELLFTAEEARLVAKLPIRPFTAEQAAGIWQVSRQKANQTLQRLADKALLVDIQQGDCNEYVLPPPMAGFFEFAMMRTREDLDQTLLAELFEQYISIEEDFIKGLFTNGKTQLGRTLVQEPALTEQHSLHVLDYQRATHIIETASSIGIGLCYCRHKRQHLGTNCAAPLNNCMTFNTVAASLIRHGHARAVSKQECLELLAQAWDSNLAQFGENVQRGVNFICNCCPCCCEAMLAQQRFGILQPIHTSNFIARVQDNCSGCGLCLPCCPAKVISLTGQDDRAAHPRASIDEGLCLGCGVCIRNCPRNALVMAPRASRVITPVNSVHKSVLMAIERGKLQNLIFDNQVLWSHRALAAVFGAILNLSPVKRCLAGKQLGSRYLANLCDRLDSRPSDG